MKLYRLTQDKVRGYDTYDSCIVCAKSKKDAIIIHPYDNYDDAIDWEFDDRDTWCRYVEDVEVEFLWEAKKDIKRGIIVSSFNAG